MKRLAYRRAGDGETNRQLYDAEKCTESINVPSTNGGICQVLTELKHAIFWTPSAAILRLKFLYVKRAHNAVPNAGR